MLAHKTVEEVRRLLVDTSLSQRQIARLVHVSHGTVQAIASGKRPDRPHGRQGQPLVAPCGPWRRCRGCGARVRMPCLACILRRAAARRRKDENDEAPDQP